MSWRIVQPDSKSHSEILLPSGHWLSKLSLVSSSSTMVRIRVLMFPIGCRVVSLAGRSTIWFTTNSGLFPFWCPLQCVTATFLGSQRASSKTSISGVFLIYLLLRLVAFSPDAETHAHKWWCRHNGCQCKCGPHFCLSLWCGSPMIQGLCPVCFLWTTAAPSY